MHKYHYQICTIPINEKHLIRKIIFSDDGKYLTHDDIKFTYVQVDKLLKKIDINEYSNFEGSNINIHPPKNIRYIDQTNIDFEKKNLDNFINGNFSYP